MAKAVVFFAEGTEECEALRRRLAHFFLESEQLLPEAGNALAGGGAWWAWRRRKALAVPADATLSAEEEARLARLLDAEPSDRDD